MTINSICGYKFDSNAEEEIKSVLLWAPIDIDYNRFHPKHGKTIAKKYGYKGDRIKNFCKKLIQDWQNQYDKAVEMIQKGKTAKPFYTNARMDSNRIANGMRNNIICHPRISDNQWGR